MSEKCFEKRSHASAETHCIVSHFDKIAKGENVSKLNLFKLEKKLQIHPVIILNCYILGYVFHMSHLFFTKYTSTCLNIVLINSQNT